MRNSLTWNSLTWNSLTWVEVSKEALAHNIKALKGRTDESVIFCQCVKANAYGHGLVGASEAFLEAGVDWLAVNALYEAEVLREAGITAPIYIMGYTMLSDLERAWELDCRQVVYDMETVFKLKKIAECRRVAEGGLSPFNIHLKIETGNNRQGILLEEVASFAREISETDELKLEGIATHFANIEDTTDHTYAFQQVDRFKEAAGLAREAGAGDTAGGEKVREAGAGDTAGGGREAGAGAGDTAGGGRGARVGDMAGGEKVRGAGAGGETGAGAGFMMHCANSAATILYPETHFDMVRVGISGYGMWPSPETRVSYQNLHKNGFELKPAFTWKSVVAQIKTVPKDSAIGYGCTFRTTRDTKMAIIPVGYYDGYDRRLSNTAHVLIRGRRAKVLGRVCMNVIMVDVSDIPDVALEDEVVLMGRQVAGAGLGDAISAEQFADWIGTINYEVTTRVNERIPRVYV